MWRLAEPIFRVTNHRPVTGMYTSSAQNRRLGGASPPRSTKIQSGPVAQSADALRSRRSVLRDMQVRILPGPPLRVGGVVVSVVSYAANRGSIPRPASKIHAPLVQQQNTYLTSRGWGCNSLTGYQPPLASRSEANGEAVTP